MNTHRTTEGSECVPSECNERGEKEKERSKEREIKRKEKKKRKEAKEKKIIK